MSLFAHKPGPMLIWLLVILFTGGCAVQKSIVPLSRTIKAPDDCKAIYPRGPWKAMHRIEAEFSGGRKASLIGITEADPAEKRIHSVLMTPEGMVLFDASCRGEQVEIKRGVPPFDSKDFAKALLADVAFMFIPPSGEPTQSGFTDDNRRVCRWKKKNGPVIETEPQGGKGWSTRQYDEKGRLVREVEANGPIKRDFAETMTLKAHTAHSYRLTLTLMEIDP